jgi:DNA-binding NtrC family response regulator
MTPEQMEQDFIFLRGQVQRLSRIIDALETSPLLIAAVAEPAPTPEPEPENAPTIRTIAELEREAILAARRNFGGNQRAACVALGIGRTKYYRKLKE